MTVLSDIISATCAGCASTLVGHPLDTLKVHLQTRTDTKTSTTLHVARNLVRDDGPSVFLRGIGPPLCNAIVMNTVMFFVFERVKELFVDGGGGDGSDDYFASSLAAGFVSGIVTAFISTPTDFVKIRAQLTGSTSADVLRRTLRSPSPVSVLFRGHVPNLAREGVFTMVYLGLYDCLMTNDDANTSGQQQHLVRIALTSSLTGGLAWVASYPCDTVKSVMQASSSKRRVSVRDAVDVVWSRGGVSAFYWGCGASTGRAVLVTSTRMLAYESVRRMFG